MLINTVLIVVMGVAVKTLAHMDVGTLEMLTWRAVLMFVLLLPFLIKVERNCSPPWFRLDVGVEQRTGFRGDLTLHADSLSGGHRERRGPPVGYFGSKATSGLCQLLPGLRPPHDLYVKTHLGSGALMKRKAG